MELARRSAVIVLVIAAIVAAGLVWRNWTKASSLFTVTDGAVGREHARRRCAKKGLTPVLVDDARPGHLIFRCGKG